MTLRLPLAVLAPGLGLGLLAAITSLAPSPAQAQGAGFGPWAALAPSPQNRLQHPRLSQANPGGWGLVLGADASAPGASAEVTRAAQSLGVKAAIYRCGNWYRTIVVVRQKQQALDLLSRAQTSSPYNPYLVDMASWCPNKTLVP